MIVTINFPLSPFQSTTDQDTPITKSEKQVEPSYLNKTQPTFDLKSANQNNIHSKVETAELAAFPNPFLDRLNIDYFLPEMGEVELSLYDQFGRLIKVIRKENLIAGQYQEVVEDNLSAGIYWVRLKVGDKIHLNKKVVRLKD